MLPNTTKPAEEPRPLLLSLLLIPACAVLLFLVILPISWRAQAGLGLAFIVAAALANRLSKGRTTTLALTLLACFSTARYAYYRYSETAWNVSTSWSTLHVLDLTFVFLLLAAESYAFLILFLGCFQTLRPLKRNPLQMPEDYTTWPKVDVFIPTYNEPLEVVKPTVLAALNMDWPPEKYRVAILDDGRRREFEEFAEACGADYITRLDNAHAKAGNINSALRQTDGEFIAIFDCDHIPTRSFLQVTMGWFLADSRLAMVQTPHLFYSPDPFERNLNVFRKVPNEGALFYGIIQDGNDLWNATFFCGSCAILRRTALEEIGGVAVETVTEDAHTALRMHSRGWNTAYINIPQAAGLATLRLSDHVGQRIRWARGMVQILRVDNPLFLRGLKLPQRLCYFNAALHFLFAAPRLIFLTSPLVYLLLGRYNVFGYLPTILAYAFPHLVISTMLNSRVQGRHRHSFWNEIYEIVLAPYILLPTWLALINPRWGKFNVTAKDSVLEGSAFDWRIARPFLVLAVLNVLGVIAGVRQYLAYGDANGILAINLFWAFFNLLLLGGVLAVAFERQQRRSHVRVRARLPVNVALASGEILSGRTVDLSNGGLSARFLRTSGLVPGTLVTVIVSLADKEAEFPVRVLENRGAEVRFEFQELNLEQYAALTRAVFSRADTWLEWSKGWQTDRPLRSMFTILGISFQGLYRVIRSSLVRSGRDKDRAKPLPRKPEMAVPSILILLLSLFSAAQTGRGQATPKTSAAPSGREAASSASRSSFREQRSFEALGYRSGILLRRSGSHSNVYFGVPLTKLVGTASLDLRYRVSPGLVSGTSRINILLNGSPVGSVPVAGSADSASTIARTEVAVPAELFLSENTLTFELIGSCTAGCDEEDEMGVWASVEPSTELHTSGTYLLLPNNLAVLPAPFFDPSAQRVSELPFVLEEHPDSVLLQAAGIVASWFGIKADYHGIHFPVQVGRIPPGNVVLVGTRDSPLVASLGITVQGPTIVIRENPNDPYGKVLAIAGNDEPQLLTAARAFSLGRYTAAGDRGLVQAGTEASPRRPYDAPRWMQTDRDVDLTHGTAPADLEVAGSGRVNLYFRLPPDLYYGTRDLVPLRLQFRHTRLLRAERAEVKIHLNGNFVAARPIRLNSPLDFQWEMVQLPAAGLYPRNTLAIEFVYEHVHVPAGSPRLPQTTVLPGTNLMIQGISHFTEMPRLDLFAGTGFPFTRIADLSQTTVVLPAAPTADEYALYLTALGFLGAQTGYPGIGVSVMQGGVPAEGWDKDLLLLGTYRDLAPVEAWPRSFYLTPERDRIRIGSTSGFDLLWGRLPFTHSARELRQLETLLQSSPRIDGIVQAFRSPVNRERNAVAVTAISSASVAELAARWSDPANADQVWGDLSLLYGGRFHSYTLNRHRYYEGQLGTWQTLQYWSRRFYWLSPVVVLIWIWILAVLLDRWLEAKAAIRLQVQR